MSHHTRSGRFGYVFVFGALLSLPLLLTANAGRLIPQPRSAEQPASSRAAHAGWGKMPLYFVPNHGQLDGQADYCIPGRSEQVSFNSHGFTFALARPAPPAAHDSNSASSLRDEAPFATSRVTVAFRGARLVKPVGAADLGTRFSYFTGPRSQWKTGIPAFGRLTYRNLWSGIDLAFRGNTDRLKYEFRVRPGADPARIRLAYQGAQRVRVDDAGKLVADTNAGELTDAAPVTYQVIRGRHVPVSSRWQVREGAGAAEVSLALGRYDHHRSLIIDPETFIYCGYIGGTEGVFSHAIAVDSEGAAYVAGNTLSNPSQGFPAAVGPSLAYGGGGNLGAAFVAKVNPDGSGLQYCGYINGSQGEECTGIAVDGNGAGYVTGYTQSSPADGFPAVVGPSLTYDIDPVGRQPIGFVAEIVPDGSALAYAGYIDGADGVFPSAIAVDGGGAAYVAGTTTSTSDRGFPGPQVSTQAGSSFVAKVTPDGSGFAYCSAFAGNGATGIAIDADGAAHVTGSSFSDRATGFFRYRNQRCLRQTTL